MTTSSPNTPIDDEQRQLAIRERKRNLLVDAGAGTGKTSLIVRRLLEMIAPRDDADDAYRLDRVAAITFTRRAAGELRLRVRQEILNALSEQSVSQRRRERLLSALGQLDTAFIGTIHSFADRLLRLYPVEAKVSPTYEIVEDEDELAQEAYLEMLQAAQTRTLKARFLGTALEKRATEVEDTLMGAVEARLRSQTEIGEVSAKVGLDWFVAELLKNRDCPFDPPAPRFELTAFQRAVEEYGRLVKPLTPASKGETWMLSFDSRLREAAASRDPRLVFNLVRQIDGATKELKATDFPKEAREVWSIFRQVLASELTAPIRRWMACRLVRMRPIAEAFYEETKLRRHNVDNIDLLLKLARLMRDDLQVRGEYQQLFDHVFVDEVQDIDLLQVEIVLFLSEQRPTAKSWTNVVVGGGRLTLVGDPKQSIYRFRRADIAMYDALHSHIKKQPDTLTISLTTNFRSTTPLVNWCNERFASVLGVSELDFDASTGRVFHKPLSPYRSAREGSAVDLLPFALPAESTGNAPELRALEAEAIAQYIRSLMTDSSRAAQFGRPLRYRDIAVLAIVTTQLSHLFDACDELSVPYTASGGGLFLRDPLHQQFLLGLRALSDPDDGVAEAALLRPPFFSIDLWDVVQSMAPEEASVDAAASERGCGARELVRELRRDRFNRLPGTTARRLLEQTAFGQLAAIGPNGEQRVRQLYELCGFLDQRALEDGLDFDRVSALARSWVDWPVHLEASRPVWSDAVQVMSVHQAKGLEFPVVVLWDSCGQWRAADRPPCFVVKPSRRQWAVHLDGLKWQEPAGTPLLEEEQEQSHSERRRVVYVAATRARDLLVVPHAPEAKTNNPEKFIHAMLSDGRPEDVHKVEAYRREQLPSWVVPPAPATALTVASSDIDEVVREKWSASIAKSKRAVLRPTGVTTEVKRPKTATEDADSIEHKRREGRYGPVFGETVHRAIGLVLTRSLTLEVAVDRSARVTGLAEHLDEAAADVTRALETLMSEGITKAECVRLEYPVGSAEDQSLVTGYIDLLFTIANSCTLLDFKTDHAPERSAQESHPEYVAQLEAYSGMLAGAYPNLRRGLLWTATGRLEWTHSSESE